MGNSSGRCLLIEKFQAFETELADVFRRKGTLAGGYSRPYESKKRLVLCVSTSSNPPCMTRPRMFAELVAQHPPQAGLEVPGCIQAAGSDARGLVDGCLDRNQLLIALAHARINCLIEAIAMYPSKVYSYWRYAISRACLSHAGARVDAPVTRCKTPLPAAISCDSSTVAWRRSDKPAS